MIQSGPELAELLVGRGGVVLVDTEQGAVTQCPHRMMETGVGVLVEGGFGAVPDDERHATIARCVLACLVGVLVTLQAYVYPFTLMVIK